MAAIVLLRHGETDWSVSGQHTGLTDLPLTENGRKAAASLEPELRGHHFGLVLCSPFQRARDTAQLAGLHPDAYIDDLHEWDYGGFEGLTTDEIRQRTGDPDWVIWDTPIPPGKTPGEQPEEVQVRCQRVLDRCLPILDKGEDCALVAHGHVLRIFTATWLGLGAREGRRFALATGRLSEVGFERETHVITLWNSTSWD